MVLLAAAPVDRLFVHSGGEGERDRQLLDDLGLSGVKCARAATLHGKLNVQGTLQNKIYRRGTGIYLDIPVYIRDVNN